MACRRPSRTTPRQRRPRRRNRPGRRAGRWRRRPRGPGLRPGHRTAAEAAVRARRLVRRALVRGLREQGQDQPRAELDAYQSAASANASAAFRYRWSRHQDRRPQRSRSPTRQEIARWAADYGDDSDFFCVRVKGEFLRGGASVFIDSETVEEATHRPAGEPTCAVPLVMGVDWQGAAATTRSVIWFRRGRDARTVPAIKLRVERSHAVLSGKAAEQAMQHQRGGGVHRRGRHRRRRGRRSRAPDAAGPVGGRRQFRRPRRPLHAGRRHVSSPPTRRPRSGRRCAPGLKTGAIPDDPELEGRADGPRIRLSTCTTPSGSRRRRT